MTSLPVLNGHRATWQRLCDALAGNCLAHALLFTGPPGIGKWLTARWLAVQVACVGNRPAPCGDCPGCLQAKAGTHPDLLLVGLLPGKREIGVDQARHLKRFVQMHAVAAQRKTAIIDDAERLSVAAQNALLKTLEEPPGQALVILVTAGLGALLPTVRSRCQRIVFQPLAPGEVCKVLEQSGLDREEARMLAARAEGSPGRAFSLRETWQGDEREELLRLLADLDATRYVSVVAMSKALGRTEADMAARLEELLTSYHTAALQAAAGEADTRREAGVDAGIRAIEVESAVRGADHVANALKALRRRNPNRPLLAEALALRLARS